jgi:hypothetical protein
MPYKNWAAGQPDGENSPHGNCLILSHLDGFKWHDVECQSDNLRYICEKKGKHYTISNYEPYNIYD